jgi:hypothetical protein
MMPCILCPVDDSDCGCCAYIADRPAPAVPAEFQTRYNRSTTLPECTRLAKNIYIDAICTNKRKLDVSPDDNDDNDDAFGCGVDAFFASVVPAKRAAIPEKLVGGSVLPLAVIRLRRFQRAYAILCTLPGKDKPFHENDQIARILTATHLKVIVGDADASDHALVLHSMIDTIDYSSIEYLVWVTSRQQGKTTVLARFAACLMITGITSIDEFINVYSTTKNRSCGLLAEAKAYIDWIMINPDVRERLAEIGLDQPLTIPLENQERVKISSMAEPNVWVTIRGRPAAANSCRGEAPRVVLADEFAFLQDNMWKKMLRPLFSISDRVGTLATTPGPVDSETAVFMKITAANMKKGMNNFYLINHSFMCNECQKNRWMTCYHMMYLLPPWKSHFRIQAILQTVPEHDRADFLAEMYGRAYDCDSQYFPEEVVTATLIGRARVSRVTLGDDRIVVIACDPASHEVSSIGFSAMVYDDSGRLVIIGHAEIPMQKCETAQVQICISAFTESVLGLKMFRRGLGAPRLRVLPVVEANNCGILSKSIVTAINETATAMGAMVLMPFTKDLWGVGVCEETGIYTSETTKMRGIQHLYGLMVRGQLYVLDSMVTLGAVHIREKPPSIASTMTKLRDSLIQFKDDKRGKVTGKTATTNDDGAMALIIGASETDLLLQRLHRGDPLILRRLRI